MPFYWPFVVSFDCCMHWPSWWIRIPLFLIAFLPLVVVLIFAYAVICTLGLNRGK